MAKARFEAKKYDLDGDRSQKLFECGDYFASTYGKRSEYEAPTLPTMTDGHTFAVARPERQMYLFLFSSVE